MHGTVECSRPSKGLLIWVWCLKVLIVTLRPIVFPSHFLKPKDNTRGIILDSPARRP